MSIVARIVLVLAASVIVPSGLRASDCYYLIMFGAQDRFNRPANAHTFATFVHVAAGPAGPRLCEAFTISWLPSTLKVRPFAFCPEAGTNVPFEETMDYLEAHADRVSMWGPFQIVPELFQRAQEKRSRLQSGAVRYRAVDPGRSGDQLSNCYHAIGDLAEGSGRLRFVSLSWGEAATYFVTLSLLPQVIDSSIKHEWVAEMLGLNAYPLVRRELQSNPTRNPALRAVQSVLRLRLTRNLRR